jgi:membrane protein DedA with SNARE-associated domain
MFDALLASHGLAAYLLIIATLLGGAFGLPFPEDLSLIIAGVLVASDNATLWIMALTCYLGIIVGDVIIYRLGWMTGPRIFRKRLVKKYLTASKLQGLRANLERRTFATIFIARHLFYLRTITFLVCGAVRVSFVRFLIADAIAALLTTPLMLGIGYLFAQHFDIIVAAIKQIKLLLVLGGVGVAIYLYFRFRRKVESPVEEGEEESGQEGADDEDMSPESEDTPTIH